MPDPELPSGQMSEKSKKSLNSDGSSHPNLPAQSYESSGDSKEDNEAIELLKKNLLECIEHGISSYKSLMEKLLSSKPTLKDSQLRHYHQETLNAVKEALSKSFESKLQIPKIMSTKLGNLLAKSFQRLETLINKQFNEVFLRKHALQLESIVKKVKEFTNLAEILFEEQLDEIQLEGKSRTQIRKIHKKITANANKAFDDLIKENNLENETFWKIELKQKLKERLEDLLEECGDNISINDNQSSDIDTSQTTLSPKNKIKRRKSPPQDLASELNANDEVESKSMINAIKQDLEDSIATAVQRYNILMESILETKQPLKSTQLNEFHAVTQEIVSKALDVSYKEIESISQKHFLREGLVAVKEAKEKLTNLVNKQFNNVFKKKHEIQMDSLVKKVKELTIHAEKSYETAQLHLEGKTRKQIEVGHENVVKETIQIFEVLMKDHKITNEEFWMCELKQKLRDRLKLLLNDLPTEQKTKSDTDVERLKSGKKIDASKFDPTVEPSKSEQENVPQNTSSSVNISEEKHFKNEEPTTEDDSKTNIYEHPKCSFEKIPSKKSSINKKQVSPSPDTSSKGQETSEEFLLPKTSYESGRTAKHTINQPLTDTVPNKKIGVGVLLSHDSFKVGLYLLHSNSDTEKENFKEIISTSPEIYFHSDGVFIGQKAREHKTNSDSESSKSNYFNIYDLITQERNTHKFEINMQKNKYILCIHQIIASFLKQLMNPLENKNKNAVEKLIITINFPPTMSAKERILKSANIAGYKNIKIISSLLSFGIVALNNLKLFDGLQRSYPKYIFLLDCQKSSFLMGLLEVSQSSIVLKNPYGSDNIKKCSKIKFLKLHENLYNGKEIGNQYKHVDKIYKEAIHYVCRIIAREAQITQIQCLVVKDKTVPKMDSIILRILKRKFNVIKPDPVIVHNSLEGASILAAIDGTNEILPKGMKVEEPCRLNLNLFVRFIGGKKKSKCWKIGSDLEKGTFCTKRIKVPARIGTPSSALIQLDELYFNYPPRLSKQFNISMYDLIYKRESHSCTDTLFSSFNLKIECTKDSEGRITLKEKFTSSFPLELEMKKVGTDQCNSICLGSNVSNSDYMEFLRFVENTKKDPKAIKDVKEDQFKRIEQKTKSKSSTTEVDPPKPRAKPQHEKRPENLISSEVHSTQKSEMAKAQYNANGDSSEFELQYKELTAQTPQVSVTLTEKPSMEKSPNRISLDKLREENTIPANSQDRKPKVTPPTKNTLFQKTTHTVRPHFTSKPARPHSMNPASTSTSKTRSPYRTYAFYGSFPDIHYLSQHVPIDDPKAEFPRSKSMESKEFGYKIEKSNSITWPKYKFGGRKEEQSSKRVKSLDSLPSAVY